MNTALDLPTLESHLWEAANILRGPVDAADFKTYIFPLLFFKRISDVFDEEVAQALDESGGDEDYALFPENHRFQIPKGCHWENVRARSTNIGQARQRALREIDRADPQTLYAIFGDAPWSNEERLSDELLRDLIEHVSQLSLSNQNVDSDVLGQAYEYLIKKFADATYKKAGEFYTPLGTIGSADRVLKNPILRDSLHDQFGVKAIEMEGSGVADAAWQLERSYLVVRGICDYCDIHKNDVWQEYAPSVVPD